MALALVLRVEDALQRAAARGLARLGRPVRLQPIPSLATPGATRVRGRVLLRGPRTSGRATRSTTWSALRTNLGHFTTVEVPAARVRVELDGWTQVVAADREGYVDVLLHDVALSPGRHTATMTPVTPPGDPAASTVHVPDPAADVAVVSDIDDTIVDSGIARGLLATITTALLRDAATRVPLEGAAELYRALAEGAGAGPPRPFVYLSTSPWNLVGFLQGFLHRNGFPEGPLLLTDWGPSRAGLLRVGTQQHKRAALEHLAAVLPSQRFVLIGDSGQQDAQIYTAFALGHPGRVASVLIRRAGAEDAAGEQALADCATSLAEAGVPYVLAQDSAAMLRAAQGLGLAPP